MGILVPWSSCSWRQRICGQKTAGNHRQLFHPVLWKSKVLRRLRQRCLCLDGCVVLMLLSCARMHLSRMTYKSGFAQELLGLSCEHVVGEDGALRLLQILVICEEEEEWMLERRQSRSAVLTHAQTFTMFTFELIQSAGIWAQKKYWTKYWPGLTLQSV